MKKIFLATTAIAALSVAGAANAAEWSAGIGGYMQIGVAFDGTDSVDGIGILRDGEIHAKAKMVADNGLTFDARVEFEATSQSSEGDDIDENWARVSGSFGSIKVGGDDSAKNAYNNGVIYSPGARVGYYDAFGLVAGSSQAGVNGSGDDVGIHYDSPNWMGFSFGASYIPDRTSDNNNEDSGVPVFESDSKGDEFWSFGAAYSGSFNDVGVGISAAIGDAKDEDTTWHIAGNVSFSGFTVAGGYEENDSDNDEWYVGARYSMGPWTLAGGYSNADGASEDTEVIAGWVSYAVAPGVTGNVGIVHEDSDGVDSEMAGLAWMTMSF
jgi:predicted porin